MLKNVFLAMLFAVLAARAEAEPDWAQAVIDEAKTYNRVLAAEWSQSQSLWLFAQKADIRWDTVTEGMLCYQFVNVGMPAGEKLLVVWFDYAASLQGRMERIAEVWCN